MADKTRQVYDVGTQASIAQGFQDLGNNTWADASSLPPQDNTFLASSARTTTQTQADQTNAGWRGIIVTLDMTVVGTGSVTLSIQGKDIASGKYYTLLAGAAVITNVTNTYTVFPSAPVTTNVSANAELPRTWRILVTANNANAATYSVGYTLLP